MLTLRVAGTDQLHTHNMTKSTSLLETKQHANHLFRLKQLASRRVTPNPIELLRLVCVEKYCFLIYGYLERDLHSYKLEEYDLPNLYTNSTKQLNHCQQVYKNS